MITQIRQPYKSWKGNLFEVSSTTNSVVPTNSRPRVNGASDDPSLFTSAFGRARPLKQYRKQLQPNPNSGKSRVSYSAFERPGGSVYLGEENVKCHTGDDDCETGIVKNYIEQQPFCKVCYKSNCTSCSVGVTHIIRSGLTDKKDPKQKYYHDRKAYLQSRCLTYQQKLSVNPREGVTYVDSNGKPLPPSDSYTGSQVFNAQNCGNDCDTGSTKPRVTIYKPSNSTFAVQGAVSSGSRIARLKYNTITRNGASFRSAFGQSAANAGRYRGDGNAAYFVKSKNNVCKQGVYRRTGKKTACKMQFL